MSIVQSLLFFAVSFIASIVGAICGIGGGVIIKPVLDLFGWASVSAISFLSGCTVLAMSCYSVGRSLAAGEKAVDLRTGTKKVAPFSKSPSHWPSAGPWEACWASSFSPPSATRRRGRIWWAACRPCAWPSSRC